MKTGIQQIFTVSDELLKDCYMITDQTRPGEAVALYHTLRDDVEKRGNIMFVFNGAAFPLGFIKGKILQTPDFKLYTPYGIQAKIENLYVDKKYQRAGIGHELLRAYEDYCRDKNVSEIILYGAPTVQASSFYAKNGFHKVNANLLMAKSLVNKTR